MKKLSKRYTCYGTCYCDYTHVALALGDNEFLLTCFFFHQVYVNTPNNTPKHLK
jgi:hypothetical protein